MRTLIAWPLKQLTLLAGLLLIAVGSLQSQTPVEKHGKLRIENGQIVNQNSEAPQLRGISFSWSLWQGQKYYNEEVVDWLCQDFNVSLLRASMGVEPKGGYLDDKEMQLELMTRVIDRAIENGVYILIDWHDHNGEKNLEASKAFFAEMARKYAGTPHVIYEIFNEPARQSWEVVKAYSEEVIRVIRQYDAENLIVVGSPHWDQDVDVAAAEPITGFDNLCYSFHFYASDDHHQKQLRDKANKALELGLPLFVTEWGVGEANGDGKFDRKRTETWMKWMETNRLSWVNWNVTDKAETTALLKPGAPANGSWTADQLTESGKYIRKKLRELNK
ncbi:MAG: glycoside hydrolase family 5 protein [Mangrovibacterium sp.]